VRGFEGVPFSKFKTLNSGYFYGANSTIGNLRTVSGGAVEVDLENNGFKAGTSIMLWQPETGGVYYGSVSVIPNHISITRNHKNLGLSGQDSSIWNVDNTKIIYFAEVEVQAHSQANPTWADIIGTPANLAATFPNGVQGQWIPVIPTDATLTYTMNRKADAYWHAAITDTNGAIWLPGTPSYWDDILGTNNGVASPIATSRIVVLFYETRAHFTQDDVSSEVLDLGNVRASCAVYAYPNSTLIGKVPRGTTYTKNVTLIKPLSNVTYWDKTITGSTSRWDKLVGNLHTYGDISHSNLDLYNNDGSAVKTLDYLSRKGGRAKLMYAYKEMVWDTTLDTGTEFQTVDSSASVSFVPGTYYFVNLGLLRGNAYLCVTSVTTYLETLVEHSDGNLYGVSSNVLYMKKWDGNGWGDNNQFEIADNQSSLTDDNGNTVLYGTASFDLPYFIGDDE